MQEVTINVKWCSLDFQNSFDKVIHTSGIDCKKLKIIINLYTKYKGFDKVENVMSEEIKMKGE